MGAGWILLTAPDTRATSDETGNRDVFLEDATGSRIPSRTEDLEVDESAGVEAAAADLFNDVVHTVAENCGQERLRVRWTLSQSMRERLVAEPSVRVELVPGDPCSDQVVARVVYGEGLQTGRLLVTGAVEVHGDGYRLARALRKGEVLEAQDVELVPGWFPPGVNRVEPPEGLVPLRPLSAGAWLHEDDLGPAPFVRRGETVAVVYSAPGLQLHTVGLARKDGWMGDRVSVRVEGARHDCVAMVESPGRVRVESKRSGS